MASRRRSVSTGSATAPSVCGGALQAAGHPLLRCAGADRLRRLSGDPLQIRSRAVGEGRWPLPDRVLPSRPLLQGAGAAPCRRGRRSAGDSLLVRHVHLRQGALRRRPAEGSGFRRLPRHGRGRQARLARLSRRRLFPQLRRAGSVRPLGPRHRHRSGHVHAGRIPALHRFLVRAFAEQPEGCRDLRADGRSEHRRRLSPGMRQVRRRHHRCGDRAVPAHRHQAHGRGAAHQHVLVRRDQPPPGARLAPGNPRHRRPGDVDRRGRAHLAPAQQPAAGITVSAFIDTNPKGFGLLQRDRNFDHYQDDGVFYDRRPSVWVEPHRRLGRGRRSQLVEIPTDDEIHDNIVAYWVPGEAGQGRLRVAVQVPAALARRRALSRQRSRA